MKKRYEINPNNPESLDRVYIKKRITPQNERFNEWMMQYLEKCIPQEGTVIDVGCCMGKTLSWIYEKNNSLELIGTEISDYSVKLAGEYYKNIKFIKEDSEFSKHEDISLVICSQTLEHVDNPKEIILNMVSWIKDGGYLFITVPLQNSNLDRGCKMHQWSFCEQDFRDIIGFDVTFIKPDKNHLIVIWQK